MKIMKAFDKRVGDTEYYKYRVNLPLGENRWLDLIRLSSKYIGSSE